MAELLAGFDQFHFLRPLWLLALLPLTALIFAIRYRRQRGGAWQRVIHPRLLPLLVSGAGGQRAWPAGAMLVAAVLACLALAGPTWERTAVASNRMDSALVILFDLSPSMLAADVRPDRLTRARLKTIDILKRHREGSVALVAWAGDAHVVTPLTDDANTLLALLPVLHPDIMPRPGSNPELALEKGLELLMNAGHLSGDLLFVTDGFVEQAVENLQQTLRSFPEFRLSILGVGSDAGAPIPLSDGGFARDSRGGIVVAQLGSTLLQRLAERNGGRYSTLEASDRDIDHLLQPIIDQASGRALEQERTLNTWLDRGPWLVLALLPFAVLAFRRNLLALLLLAPLLGAPSPARADDAAPLWDKLWHNRDRLAHQALQNHQPERAADLFQDPQWRAVADYRRGDFAAAAEGFAADPSATGRFNLGNALARQGQLEEALAAYEQALAINPDHADARANHELIEQLLNNQANTPQKNTGDGDSEQDDSGSDSANGDSSSDADSESGAETEQPGDGQSGDSAPEDRDPGDGESGDEEHRDKEPGDKESSNEPDTGQQKPPQQSGADGDDREHTAEQPPSDGEASAPMSDDSPPVDSDSPGVDNSDPAQQQDTQPGAPDPQSAREADATAADADTEDSSDPELEYWLRQVTDDPGGLLRRKFEYQSRQQALEPRQRFELPPDRFQEERW